MRVIMHLDMDYFFAQVEERDNPSLKPQPVVIGADPKGGSGRGVVSTCNYIARDYGIHSAMPISIAYRKCPKAVFLRPSFSKYVESSQKIMEMLGEYCDSMEQISLDEAFMDVSTRVHDFDEAKEYADKLRHKIYDTQHLTASIGVAPNKLVAKIASDYKKPFGLTLVKPHQVEVFLEKMSVRKLWGIGPKTEERLNKIGIKTIGQLAKARDLEEHFGVWGERMKQYARGIDNSPVESDWETKSIGRERTFETDTKDKDQIFDVIDRLCFLVHAQLDGEGLRFRTVSIKIRFSGFETHTHAKTISLPTDDVITMQRLAKGLTEDYLASGKKVRLIGVRVSGLEGATEQKNLREFLK